MKYKDPATNMFYAMNTIIVEDPLTVAGYTHPGKNIYPDTTEARKQGMAHIMEDGVVICRVQLMANLSVLKYFIWNLSSIRCDFSDSMEKIVAIISWKKP